MEANSATHHSAPLPPASYRTSISPSLNVVALISGGKDSLFSILHCIANGHRVVALANLHPKDTQRDDQGHQIENEEDLNSYMFQTVGHSIIRHYADALGLPLYQAPISGSAVDRTLEYNPQGHRKTIGDDSDEAEDLTNILTEVKRHQPEVNAVSTGAILSTYQRTRVESVAVRLGLTPLSYLWQYPQLPPHRDASLLEDMYAAGQISQIIKVSSGGLDESFLGCNVADPKIVSRLKSRMRKFGFAIGDVLGEGGEFETLAIEGPPLLWKKRIRLGQSRVIQDEGGSSHLMFSAASTEELKDSCSHGPEAPRQPPLLDDEFHSLYNCLNTPEFNSDEQQDSRSLVASAVGWTKSQFWASANGTSTCKLTNMVSGGTTAAEQMSGIGRKLTDLLEDQYNLDPSAVTSTTLLLRRMDDFVAINAEYGKLFTWASPPSRVTVSCGELLPAEYDVMLSITFEKSHGRRRGLHVQSRSYWAPANIGPYSQAIAVPISSDSDVELIHIAGQIPLVPARMDLTSGQDLPMEESSEEMSQLLKLDVVLSLQHLIRVGRAMDVSAFTGAIAFIPECDSISRQQLVSMALQAWDLVHARKSSDLDKADSESEDIDVWDLRNGMARSQLDSSSAQNVDLRRPLPDFSVIQSGSPPAFVVQVEQLPRSASIEWTSLGLNKEEVSYHTYHEGHAGTVTRHETRCNGLRQQCIAIGKTEKNERLSAYEVLNNYCRGGVFAMAYVTSGLEADWLERSEAQVVPCKRVWGIDGKRLSVLVVVEDRS
jgi:diphthine-ammonia ligase